MDETENNIENKDNGLKKGWNKLARWFKRRSYAGKFFIVFAAAFVVLAFIGGVVPEERSIFDGTSVELSQPLGQAVDDMYAAIKNCENRYIFRCNTAHFIKDVLDDARFEWAQDKGESDRAFATRWICGSIYEVVPRISDPYGYDEPFMRVYHACRDLETE